YGADEVLEVDDQVFYVPRHGFLQASTVFSDMFTIPQPLAPEVIEGHLERPIILAGYKAKEFKALLKVLYPTSDSFPPCAYFNLSQGEWVDVLKLSTVWLMTKIRLHCIKALSVSDPSNPLHLTTSDKVKLGRAYRVPRWVREGIVELVRLPELSLDSIRELGLETACQIFAIRD
ncbi:hypothetical protein FA13DRAFT_1612810, partial [Coprinellus micaceus]